MTKLLVFICLSFGAFIFSGAGLNKERDVSGWLVSILIAFIFFTAIWFYLN